MSKEPEATDPDACPRVFGNYEFVTGESGDPVMLGEGTFGRTYLAIHPVLGKHAAIKVISEAHLHRTSVRDEFLREARNAAQLEHPNVARVMDSGDAGGTLYYVMDYCAGGDMQQLCETSGPLPEVWLYELLRQMLEALKHAHKQGYVHRDIKPSNIMMASRELPPVFKLIDFGLTKSLGGDQATSPSPDSRFMGTLMFASPEQLREETVDACSDLFALGMTAWYLAKGEAPVEDRMATIVADRLSSTEYQAALPAELSASMRSFLGNLLRKDRRRRVQSAAEALKLLTSEVGSHLHLPSNPDDWALREKGPPAGSGTSVKPVAPPVEHVDGSFRTRYDERVFEETDADSNMLVGAVPCDAASGQPVVVMVVLLADKGEAARLANMAVQWAMLPFREVGRLSRIEVFSDAVSLVSFQHGPGFDMLSVLRSRGLMRMRDVGALLESIAHVADAARDKGLVGVDPSPHRIFLEFSATDEDSATVPTDVPDGPMQNWPPFELRLIPWFPSTPGRTSGFASAGNVALVASTGDWQENMTQGFAVLIYRLLSGRMPPAASLLSEEGYVPVNELSEPGNRALAAALADRGAFSRSIHLLASLSGSENTHLSTTSSVAPSRTSPPNASERFPSMTRKVLATRVSTSHTAGPATRLDRLPPTTRPQKGMPMVLGFGWLALAVSVSILVWKLYPEWNQPEEAPQPPPALDSARAAAVPATGSPQGGADASTASSQPQTATARPKAYVIHGGIDPDAVTVTINDVPADNIRTVVGGGVAIPIPEDLPFPIDMAFEAQGYERSILVLNEGDAFEREDRLVMRRSTGVVVVEGGEQSSYALLLFLMQRQLVSELDVVRSSSTVELQLLQRSSLVLPTGIYRATARAPGFREIENVELPGEIVVEKGGRVIVRLAPGLSGEWRSSVPSVLAFDVGGDELIWTIPEGYTEGMLSVVTTDGVEELAILAGMSYQMFDGLQGGIQPLRDSSIQGLPTMTFTTRSRSSDALTLVLQREGSEDLSEIELTPWEGP